MPVLKAAPAPARNSKMSISRPALLALAAVISLLLILILILPSQSAQAQAQRGAVLPETPFNFTRIFESRDIILETDTATYSSMIDEDGDMLVAGIFRLIRKNAPADEKAVFVSLTVAACGFNVVAVLHSKDYTATGQLAGETTNQPPLQIRPDTPAAATYISLCSVRPDPTPINPGYKAPERYTKFWV